jgi:penicillin-binding protein 2
VSAFAGAWRRRCYPRAVRHSPASASREQEESQRLRLTVLSLLVIALFVLLFARLWFLQVMAGERYQDLAAVNAVRTVPVEAPRGRILDRDGRVLVGTRYAQVVSVRPSEMGERRAEVLADLADLIGVSVEEVDGRLERSRVSPFSAKPIAVDVPADVVYFIHENRADRFPGVYAETLPLRDYPHGALAAHVVGYVGEISPEQLERDEYKGYRQGTLVGWGGVERAYESQLRGTEGQRQLEVNARGEVLRDQLARPPTAGADLVLSLDLDAQRATEEALATGIEAARTIPDRVSGPLRGGTFKAPAGAAAVLDPRTGEILAMASYPDFEPELFVGGIGSDDWAELQSADSSYPLVNRAIQSAFPPGSVFKPVPAAAALEEGYMTPASRLPCPGSWVWSGTRWNNWNRAHSGWMDIAQSLVHSCDTVYYELARRMWEDEQGSGAERELIAEYAQGFGLGALTGIDLPGERPGVVPSRAWKQEHWATARDGYCERARTLPAGSHAQVVNADLCESGHLWRGGDAVNTSIGQGDTLTTPLQVLNAFAAIANGGTLHRPHVATEIRHADGSVEEIGTEAIGELPVGPGALAEIRHGLEGVTAPGGTAGRVFADFPVKVAGKTGTAEQQPKQPFAWYAGYGPADDPRYAVVAVVEEGGGGSQTAAPIVRRIMEHLLDVGADDGESLAAGD